LKPKRGWSSCVPPAGSRASRAGRITWTVRYWPPESQTVFDKHRLKTFDRRLDFVKVGGAPAQALAQYREFLDLAPKGKPFALQLSFSDPHRPLDANAIPVPHDPQKIKLPAHYPDTPAVRADFARYYDEIARFDTNFLKCWRSSASVGSPTTPS